MEYRPFGKTGFKTSVFGMGTYYDMSWIASARLFRHKNNREKHIKAIRAGLDAGVNLIDTAEIYSTEDLVAEAVEGRDRESLFIATKVFPTHLKYDSLIRACDRSLKNLGMKYIDLYQVHFPSRRARMQETMSALEKLVSDGKIRHIGVSNFSLTQMLEAESCLKQNEIVSTQMPYNLRHRTLEKEIIPHCNEKGIAVLAYFPLAHGRFGSDNSRIQSIVSEISKNHGGKSPAQIALNWFYSRHEQVFPIPRASVSEHVLENVGSVDWRLEQDELKQLESGLSHE